MDSRQQLELEHAIAADLLNRHGPLLSGAEMWKTLGYRNGDAFRQALKRGTLPIPVFPLPQRRGKFALVVDIARWLALARCSSIKGKGVG